MYKLILEEKIPTLNQRDEIEEKEFKFFFGVGLLYPLKHEYNLDIPDFQKFSKKKQDFSFEQIEFIIKFLHSAHMAYHEMKEEKPLLSYRKLFIAFDGEFQDRLISLMSTGMDRFMDSLSKEENPKKPSQPEK